jgi:hydrogenase nickel incorporation protein HypA/HybF
MVSISDERSREEQKTAMSARANASFVVPGGTPSYRWGHPERADMHEMAITQSVVETVCEHAAGRRVHSVRVQVGALCGVVPDAMEFCFGLATEGTVADGASLDLDIQPGSARCRTCGHEFAMSDLILLCPCGSADVEVLAGRDLKILSMEVS